MGAVLTSSELCSTNCATVMVGHFLGISVYLVAIQQTLRRHGAKEDEDGDLGLARAGFPSWCLAALLL